MGKKKRHPGHPHSFLTKEGALAQLRAFVLDSQIPHGDEIALLLQCPPISEEVLEREYEESDLRIEKIAYLAPLLFSYADLLIEGYLSYQKSVATEEALALGDEVWNETRKMTASISRAVLVGAISQLVSMGQLRTRKPNKSARKRD
jgi:hypothetical protein